MPPKLKPFLLLIFLASVASAGPIAPPPALHAVLGPDNAITTLGPSGWTVADTERTAAGIRFYRVVGNKVEWADYALPLTVVVDAGPGPLPIVLTITTDYLPSATLGAVYSQSLAAGGGTMPYAWSITSGSLPNGLALNTGGILSGTPGTVGSFTANFQVKDAVDATAAKSLTLTVLNLPPPGKVMLLVVADKHTLDTQIGSLLGSKVVRDYLAASGSVSGLIDVDQVAKDGTVPQKYRPAMNSAAGKTMPVAVLVSPDGQTVYATIPIPAAWTPADFLNWLKSPTVQPCPVCPQGAKKHGLEILQSRELSLAG